MINQLRIGICGCTRSYYGEFENRKWIIGMFNGEVMTPRITFKFTEVFIPEQEHGNTLLAHRCHFFVDMHMEKHISNPCITIVSLYDYIPYTRTGKEGPFNGWGYQVVWHTKEPITIDKLAGGMRSIIMKMSKDILYDWLIHLTPKVDPRPRHAREEPLDMFRLRILAQREERLNGNKGGTIATLFVQKSVINFFALRF